MVRRCDPVIGPPIVHHLFQHVAACRAPAASGLWKLFYCGGIAVYWEEVGSFYLPLVWRFSLIYFQGLITPGYLSGRFTWKFLASYGAILQKFSGYLVDGLAEISWYLVPGMPLLLELYGIRISAR